jgi:16S rRNA (cytosine967-C5)-methyltransferase
VLPEENVDQAAWFVDAFPDFRLIPFGKVWASTICGVAPVSADGSADTLLLTPASHGTDGFFIASFRRTA